VSVSSLTHQTPISGDERYLGSARRRIQLPWMLDIKNAVKLFGIEFVAAEFILKVKVVKLSIY
jgi:hypothetical protein